MIDILDKNVLIIFYDKTTLSGTVLSWSDNQSSLRDDEDNIVIINNTLNDVKLIKIILKKSEQKYQELKEKEQVIIQQPIYDNKERLETLAECKIALLNQERKIISEKIRSHVPTELRKTKYEQPGLFKKPNS